MKNMEDGFLEGSKHLIHGVANGLSDFFVLPCAGVIRGRDAIDKTYKGLNGIGQGFSSLMFRPIGGVLRGIASPFIGGIRQFNSAIDGTGRRTSTHIVKADDNEKARIELLYSEKMIARGLVMTHV